MENRQNVRFEKPPYLRLYGGFRFYVCESVVILNSSGLMYLFSDTA